MSKKDLAEEYAEHEQCAHCVNPQYCQGKEDCYDFAKTKDHFLAGQKAVLNIKDASDKRLEPILYKLKDLGVIASWYKNDTYHAC